MRSNSKKNSDQSSKSEIFLKIRKTNSANPNGSKVLFDKLLRPEDAAAVLGVSVKTIYDWRYRGRLRGVPRDLFMKFNKFLYLRKDVLDTWISTQNPYVQ